MNPGETVPNDYIVICNVNIHKKTKLSRAEFLERVKNVKEIRCRKEKKFASYYITSIEEFKNLKLFYDIINQGTFPNDDYYQHLFALAINPKLYEWFRSTSFHLIERQIIFWMASIYFFVPEKRKKIYDVQFYDPIIEEIKKILNNCYSKLAPVKTKWEDEIISSYDLDKSKFEFNPEELYFQASNKFLGLDPPEFLSNPFGYSDHIGEWGIAKYNFTFIKAYFSDSDWSEIVVHNNENESLVRAESKKDLWYKWKHTFSMFEISKKNIYSFYLFGDSRFNNVSLTPKDDINKNSGYVYLMRNPIFEKNIFKIGLTRKNVEKRARGLSNTSVPDQFYTICEWYVEDCVLAERRMKDALSQFIVDPKREFFKLNHKDAIVIIENELKKL